MKLWINILLFIFAVTAGAQSDEPLAIADSMPKFPGGVMELGKHIQRNFIVPGEVRETTKSAKAFVKFVVDENGKVTNPVIVKSSNNEEFDKEAIRAISVMPKWDPGIDKGKPVKVYMTVPVSWKNGGTVSASSEIFSTHPETKEHTKAMEYYREGHKLDQNEKFQEALEKFDQALAVESGNIYALYDKAKMHRLLGDKIKACEVWNNMISKNIRKEEAETAVKNNCTPETINVPVDLVKEKKERELDKKAIESFNLGVSQKNQGRYDAALNSFNKCLEYVPDHSNALYNKALMHLKLENKSKACETWNKMIALNEKDLEVKELIKKNCN